VAADASALKRLDELTRRLRRDCPWDREQDERSIVSHTVEEAYELADAAHAADDEQLLDELVAAHGVTLNAVYVEHAQTTLFLLAEALLEYEQEFARWRFLHVQLVERIIGPGTGGTGGTLGDGPAWLGSAYAPFDTAGNARNNMNLQVTMDRLGERRNLLRTFDTMNRQIDRSGLANGRVNMGTK